MSNIPVKVFEEIKATITVPMPTNSVDITIDWFDNNGINTPYLITWVNKIDLNSPHWLCGKNFADCRCDEEYDESKSE